MKKVFLFLIGATFACTGFTQTCVTAKQVRTDYEKNKVTFSISWGDCKGDNSNHRNTVWVFVDYRDVGSSSWTRATISNKSAGTFAPNNDKGLWIYGASSTTQTITLDLDILTNKYDWCAFATDYPPQAIYNNGSYTLKGTPPFTYITTAGVIMSTTSRTVTDVCLSAITDATGCTGTAQPCCVERDASRNSGTCCAGLTLVGGYCRDLDKDDAIIYGSCDIEIKQTKAGNSAWNPHNLCDIANGWHWPTVDETCCILGLIGRGNNIWTNESYNTNIAYYVKSCGRASVAACRSAETGVRCGVTVGANMQLIVAACDAANNDCGTKSRVIGVMCVR